jgi:hypothetical protein
VKGRPKVRLRGTPWTPDFMAQLDSAKTEVEPRMHHEITLGTWRWLCTRYFAECADYLRLDERTKRVRRNIIEATFDEPIAPGSAKFFRDILLPRMTEDAVEVLRDRKVQTPEAANARLKAMRQVFKVWGKKETHTEKPGPGSRILQVRLNRFPYLDVRGSAAVRGTARCRH